MVRLRTLNDIDNIRFSMQMNQTLLCSWLGLADKHWPPDHYALLGLKLGDCDLGVIEQRVQERMARLRDYQLAHPEEATEGMNRVAQAFIFLMEQASKNGQSSVILAPLSKPVAKDDTAVGHKTVVDWHGAPPPVRQKIPIPVEAIPTVQAEAPAAPTENAASVAAVAVKPVTPALTAPPAPAPFDYLEALARESSHATRGIGTLPLLIERIEQTRGLLVAWERLGKYVKLPSRKLANVSEEKDLRLKWNALVQHLEGYPRFVAQPGRPGYRVAAFARLEMTALMFKSMKPDQRADLARDWETGRKALLLHRSFLRQQFKALRHTTYLNRFLSGVRGLVNDHPVWMSLAAMAVVTVVIWWLTR